MAEGFVVKEQLMPEVIDAGAKLTRQLHADRDFNLLCSLWLYNSETNRWKLNVGTSLADSEGPLKAYERMQAIMRMRDAADLEIPLYTISILHSNDSLVRALQSLGHFEISAPSPGPTPRVISPKRITLSPIGEAFIEDAYIYFIK